MIKPSAVECWRYALCVVMITSLGLGARASLAASNAETMDLIKIGVLTERSDGEGGGASPSVVAAEMAIEEVGGNVAGRAVSLVAAAHGNDVSAAQTIVETWIDKEGVTMITGIPHWGVALEVAALAKRKDRIAIVINAPTQALTNVQCNMTTFHYAYDTYALHKVVATAAVKQGYETWFFLTLENSFGRQLEKSASDFVVAAGGHVVGTAAIPTSETDFSRYIEAAKASSAKVIAVAAADRFAFPIILALLKSGLPESKRLAALLMSPDDVEKLGFAALPKVLLAVGFDPTRSEQARVWSRRFVERTGRVPSAIDAGVYSAVRHYLGAVAAAGTTEAQPVAGKMKELPINDSFTSQGRIREDGRMVHEMYLAEVKPASESRGPGDFYRILATVPGEEAFQPLEESTCPLIKK